MPPPTYTLTTSAPNGSITIESSRRRLQHRYGGHSDGESEQRIRVKQLEWDLGGSVNPTNITMNGNKSVTANFALIPTYTLTTSATNGSISLNPPAGFTHTGTVVTVTAIPNSGYAFGNWSGNLSGSVNPMTITMNGNKSVTANFRRPPSSGKTVLFVVADASCHGGIRPGD